MLLVLQRVWVPVCSQGPGQTFRSNTLPSAVRSDPPPVFTVLEPQRGAPSALVMDFIYYASIKGQTWADAKVTQSFEAGIHTSLTRAGGSKRLRD